jgi:hypothetical protein
MMRIIDRLKNFWPFTIKFYAISFITLMSLIFGLLGWGMQYKLNTIREEALIRNNQAALVEVNYVINHITDEIKLRAQSIARQDETRQQLFNPAYYLYWCDTIICRQSSSITSTEIHWLSAPSVICRTMCPHRILATL